MCFGFAVPVRAALLSCPPGAEHKCHSSCTPMHSYVTAQVCIQKKASRYSRFILVVEVKDSFSLDSAERELFPHSTRQAFCFAVYCQCTPQIKKHLRAFLKDLSIQSTGEPCAVSSVRVRRLSTRDNICTKCKPEAPAAANFCKPCK